MSDLAAATSRGGETADPIQIRIKTMDENTFMLDVTLTTKVAEVKELIVVRCGAASWHTSTSHHAHAHARSGAPPFERRQNQTSIPPERQRLLFRGQAMKDASTLGEHHVDDGHTLLLIARPENLPVQPSPVTAPRAGPFGAGPSLFGVGVVGLFCMLPGDSRKAGVRAGAWNWCDCGGVIVVVV